MTLEQSLRLVAELRPRLQGWCTPAKAEALVESVFELPMGPVCVEIGIFGGQSLSALAVACGARGGHVWGLDPWRRDDALAHVAEPENRDWWSKVDYELVYAQCLRTFLDFGLLRSSTIVRATSARGAALFAPSSVDLVHIDGNHSEEESLADVERWLARLKPRGILWMDDIDWPSTRRAQETIGRICDPVSLVGSCARYRKRARPDPEPSP